MPNATPPNDVNGSQPIASESANSSPTSKTSDAPQSDSNGHWHQPTNVKELTQQTNAVATAILNGQIDLETGRVYSAMVRSTAQMIGAEVARARFRRQEPDLSL